MTSQSSFIGQTRKRLEPEDLELGKGLSIESLKILLRAWCYARSARRPAWDFAVALKQLTEAGLTDGDLRWLTCKEFLSHAIERTSREDRHGRLIDPTRSICFGSRSVFVLTAPGVSFARTLLAEVFADDDRVRAPANTEAVFCPHGSVPSWDVDLRELRIGKTLVKRYRVPAENQETILTAFEEESWPARIDDPLPPVPEIDPKRRLHSAIQCLNRNQMADVLQFHGDGRGRGVCWKLLPARGV